MYNNSLISKNLQSQMTNCNENRINILQKNQKWNILIMVILVMLTASMLGLLSMSFLKEMFSYTINLDWYYKSYYFSKAWIELALTEIDNSTVWFSNSITWDDNIFTQNLCPWQDCSVTMNINWRVKTGQSEGTDVNTVKLWNWESFVLPLFYQNDTWSNASIIAWNAALSTTNLSRTGIQSISFSWNDSVGLQLYVPSHTDYIYVDSGSLSNPLIRSYIERFLLYYRDYDFDNESYLIVSNLNNDNASKNSLNFIFYSDSVELPTDKFFVTSLWSYQWKYVWMQAILEQKIQIKWIAN